MTAPHPYRCTACGAELVAPYRYCSRCGTFAPATVYVQLPPPATVAPVRRAGRIIRDDLLYAVTAVTAGFAAMAALASVSWLLVGDGVLTGMSLPDSSVALLLALAVGGSLTAAEPAVQTADLASRPLTLTIVGYTVLALIVLRRVRADGSARVSAFLRIAAPVLLAHTAALAALTVVSRSRVSLPATYTTLLPSAFELRVDLVSTLVHGTATLVIALVAAFALATPGVRLGRTEYVRALLAAPARTLRTLTLVLSAAAALGMVAALVWGTADLNRLAGVPPLGDVRDAGSLWRVGGAVALLFLPNAAYGLLLFGLGIPISGTIGFGLREGEILSVRDLTDANPLAWVLPVATIALVVTTGALAVKPSARSGWRGPAAFWLALSLPAALLLLPYALGIRAAAGAARPFFDGTTGFDPLFTLAVGAAFAVVAAAFGWALTPPRATGEPTSS